MGHYNSSCSTQSLNSSSLDDQTLREKLDERRKLADERLTALQKANSSLDDDDDGILERIFNNLTGVLSVCLQLVTTSGQVFQHSKGQPFVVRCF